MPQYSLMHLTNVQIHYDIIFLAWFTPWCHGFNCRYAAKSDELSLFEMQNVILCYRINKIHDNVLKYGRYLGSVQKHEERLASFLSLAQIP